MATQKRLGALLTELAALTNKVSSRKEAIDKGHKTFLALDFFAMYGGYNLIEIDVLTGCHYNAFKVFSTTGCRVKGAVMEQMLLSFICGVEIGKGLQNG